MNEITGVSHDLVMMYCSEFCQIGFTLGLFFGATVFPVFVFSVKSLLI